MILVKFYIVKVIIIFSQFDKTIEVEREREDEEAKRKENIRI